MKPLWKLSEQLGSIKMTEQKSLIEIIEFNKKLAREYSKRLYKIINELEEITEEIKQMKKVDEKDEKK
jgi:hypothetical protein